MEVSNEWSVADINRYYKRSVFLYKGEPVYVHCIQSNGGLTATCSHPTSSGQSWKDDTIDVRLSDLDLFYPDLGNYDYQKGVINISRAAMRQWNKGLNFKTYKVRSVIDIPEVYVGSKLTPDMIREIIKERKNEPTEAIDALRSCEAISRTISKDIWVSLYPFLDDIVLGYQTTRIGLIKSDNKAYIFQGAEALTETIQKHFEIGGTLT